MKPEHREHRLELSPIQVTGSALAAMSGAFFASWAGVAGTIVGAALASVVVTVGAATYTWSLQRTRDAVQRTAAQVRQAALVPGRTAAEEPAGAEPADRRRNLPWGKLVLTSVAVMALGLGGITAIEAVAGKPVSALTGSSSSTGTTLGDVVGSTGSGADRQDSGTSTGDQGESTTQTPTKDSDTSGAPDDGTGDTTPPTPTPSADRTPTPDPPTTEPGSGSDSDPGAGTPVPDPEPSAQP